VSVKKSEQVPHFPQLLSTLISIVEGFLKDHVTLKTEGLMLKIQLSITGINCILKCLQIS